MPKPKKVPLVNPPDPPAEDPTNPPATPPVEPPAPPKPDDIDYKIKFRESSREALALTEKVKMLEVRLGTVEKVELPSDEKMAEVYPDWEMLSDFEKNISKKNFVLEQKLNQVHSVVLESKNDREWTEKLDRFVEEVEILETFPSLSEKKAEFKKFAMKPTHRGIPLEVLAKSFLFDAAETPIPPGGGSMLESGGGGSLPPTKPAQLTAEQIATLRTTDYKRYRELVKSGTITKALSS